METQQNNTNDKLAIAGLVLGIVSVVFAFIYTWIGLAAGIVGIILSIKGRKSVAKKGLGTAGLVLSIIGTCLNGFFIACALCALGAITSAVSSMQY